MDISSDEDLSSELRQRGASGQRDPLKQKTLTKVSGYLLHEVLGRGAFG